MIRERCSRNRRGGTLAVRLSDVLSGTIAVVRHITLRAQSSPRGPHLGPRRPRHVHADGAGREQAASPRYSVIHVECRGDGEMKCAVAVRVARAEHDGEVVGCCTHIRLAG